jgi:hypothetical protein
MGSVRVAEPSCVFWEWFLFVVVGMVLGCGGVVVWFVPYGGTVPYGGLFFFICFRLDRGCLGVVKYTYRKFVRSNIRRNTL